MRIIVLGAGAIGSLYGAKLTSENDVTLIGNPAHVRAILQNGLRIEGVEQRTVRVAAAEQVEKIDPDTLIILTTKVTGSAAALAPIARLVRDDTTILCLQNGLGIEQLARDALQGRGVVLRGIAQCGAIFAAPGYIRFMAAGYTVIEAHARSERFAAAFNAAGLNARVAESITQEVWRKLIDNCVVNPITAILRCEVGAIADRSLDPLKQLVIDECLAVAREENIRLDGDLLAHINEFFAPSHNIASMQQDLLRGRPTEIDYLNGAVAALGQIHGIECPANRALTLLIKALEKQASLFPEKMLET